MLKICPTCHFEIPSATFVEHEKECRAKHFQKNEPIDGQYLLNVEEETASNQMSRDQVQNRLNALHSTIVQYSDKLSMTTDPGYKAQIQRTIDQLKVDRQKIIDAFHAHTSTNEEETDHEVYKSFLETNPHAVYEVAPPGKKAEDFITHNKEKFKKRYGKKGMGYLYATAWTKFGENFELDENWPESKGLKKGSFTRWCKANGFKSGAGKGCVKKAMQSDNASVRGKAAFYANTVQPDGDNLHDIMAAEAATPTPRYSIEYDKKGFYNIVDTTTSQIVARNAADTERRAQTIADQWNRKGKFQPTFEEVDMATGLLFPVLAGFLSLPIAMKIQDWLLKKGNEERKRIVASIQNMKSDPRSATEFKQTVRQAIEAQSTKPLERYFHTSEKFEGQTMNSSNVDPDLNKLRAQLKTNDSTGVKINPSNVAEPDLNKLRAQIRNNPVSPKKKVDENRNIPKGVFDKNVVWLLLSYYGRQGIEGAKFLADSILNNERRLLNYQGNIVPGQLRHNMELKEIPSSIQEKILAKLKELSNIVDYDGQLNQLQTELATGSLREDTEDKAPGIEKRKISYEEGELVWNERNLIQKLRNAVRIAKRLKFGPSEIERMKGLSSRGLDRWVSKLVHDPFRPNTIKPIQTEDMDDATKKIIQTAVSKLPPGDKSTLDRNLPKPPPVPGPQAKDQDLADRLSSAIDQKKPITEGPIKPNSLFDVWSPDEVAECLDGIDDKLYQKLWSLVSHYENQPRSEVPDDFGSRCLSKYWDELTSEQQEKLNSLAEMHHSVKENDELGDQSSYMKELRSFLVDQLIALKTHGIEQIQSDRILRILMRHGYDVDLTFVNNLLDEFNDIGERDGDVFNLTGNKVDKEATKNVEKGKQRVKTMANKTIDKKNQEKNDA